MATRKAPAAQAAGASDRPDFEVVGDELVCHPYGDLRLSLVISMSNYQSFLDINDTASTSHEQIARWKGIMPPEVVDAIDREAERDFAAGFTLARQWANGLDVRLGKALS